MVRVYKDMDEVMGNFECIPCLNNKGKLRMDLYLDGKKIGCHDSRNRAIKVKVRMAVEQEERKRLNVYADRSDKPFTWTDAIEHYLEGVEYGVIVNFSDVAGELKPKDFSNYSALVLSMHRKTGTLPVDEEGDQYVGGWAGNITCRLTGMITSNATEWKFSGEIAPYEDIFDFDKKEWDVRKYRNEILTRGAGKILEGGRPYQIRFKDRKKVEEGGIW